MSGAPPNGNERAQPGSAHCALHAVRPLAALTPSVMRRWVFRAEAFLSRRFLSALQACSGPPRAVAISRPGTGTALPACASDIVGVACRTRIMRSPPGWLGLPARRASALRPCVQAYAYRCVRPSIAIGSAVGINCRVESHSLRVCVIVGCDAHV